MINFPQSIIIGIHETAYEEIKYKMSEDSQNMENIIVLDLTYTYRDPKFQP